jgi:4-carboxymuconolactone decarboxylase
MVSASEPAEYMEGDSEEARALRAQARVMWREVTTFDAPPITDVYMEFTADHVMGRLWSRGVLSRRDRRLVTLTTVALAGQRDPLYFHLTGAARSGDLTFEELYEWVVHLAHYGGWPISSSAYTILREVQAAVEAEAAAPPNADTTSSTDGA